jgi:hypothetical protein
LLSGIFFFFGALFLINLFGVAQNEHGFPKNYVTVGYLGGTVYGDDYNQFGYYNLGEDFNTVQLSYSRRLTKNIYTSLSTYKIKDDNRRFTLGTKINAFTSSRVQPGLLLDAALDTSDFPGELQFGGSLDFHMGDYFVLGSTFRAGLADGLVYGFSGTVKF